MLYLADLIRESLADQKKILPLAILSKNDSRKYVERLRSLVLGAKNFILDDETAAAAAELGTSHPEILLNIMKNARTPFEKIFLEWPLKAHLYAINATVEADCPERAGVYIERLDPLRPVYRMTYVGYGSSIDGNIQDITVTPLCVIYDLEDHVGLPAASEDVMLICKSGRFSRLTLRRTLLGLAYIDSISTFDEGTSITIPKGTELFNDDILETATSLFEDEKRKRLQQCDDISRHATYAFSPFGQHFKDALKGDDFYKDYSLKMGPAVEEIVMEFAGVWRFCISALALMNAKDYVIENTPRKYGKSRLVKGTIVPYLEHRVVSLKLPRKTVIRKVTQRIGDSLPKRRVEVPGHWCNSHMSGDPTCNIKVGEKCPRAIYVNQTETRYICVARREDGSECGHKRWWKNDFEKGDASIGYVTKDYLVEKRK